MTLKPKFDKIAADVSPAIPAPTTIISSLFIQRMFPLSKLELSEISAKLGGLKLKKVIQINGGCIHSCFKLEYESSKVFLKKNNRIEKLLKFEEYCLQDLNNYSDNKNLIIPSPSSYTLIGNTEYLTMDWVDMKQSSQAKLGKGLANLHLFSSEINKSNFGYEIEGFIGLSPQIQGWEKEWWKAFIKLRIEPQLCSFKSHLNESFKNELKLKIKKILISHQPQASLVHGDLWGGNIGVDNRNVGTIFDPACWWADSEVDIAMTKLFGGFDKEFYEEYYKVIPKKAGSEERTLIYNFYHILNHANMFGGSYLDQVNSYIQKIMNI